MSCVYKRGKALWVAYNDATGKRVCRSSGFHVGQEADAREFLAQLEKQLAESLVTRTPSKPVAIGAAPPRGSGSSVEGAEQTVRAYGDAWLAGRLKRVATVGNEEGHLRNHVYPRLGDMLVRDVKPRHIRDFVLALSQASVQRRGKTGDKDSTIAPRTVRHIFATLHRMFKSAVIDEVIATNPVVVEKGVLPKNIDKDPEWRATAVFERGELVTLISDSRIPQVRRVLNALKGLAALRHGEAAGLRWSDYQTASEPLGRLVISRSYEKERTKTQITRLVPVHPALAQILTGWKSAGWSQAFGRDPEPTDLIVPNHHLEVWPAHDADDTFKDDLAAVGLRNRRGHDLRRTFITLVQVDGGRRDLLKVVTHGPAADDIINLYTTFPWPSLCAEVAKLAVMLPSAAQALDETPQPTEVPTILVVDATDGEREAETNNVVPLFGPCSATCSATSDPGIVNVFEPLARFERATYGLRNRCSTTEL